MILPMLGLGVCSTAAGVSRGADEIIKQHVQSLGSIPLKLAPPRVVEASAIYKLLVGGIRADSGQSSSGF
jgi:hypothetical protein